MFRIWLLLLITWINIVKYALAYSYMVPQESCFNLMPQHNCSQELTPSPYQILVYNTYYHPNDQIKVVLTSNQSVQFSGFILQAKLVKTNHIVGTWTYDPQLYPFIGILKCLDKNNSLVHAWPEFYPEKNKFFTNITVTWIAPNVNNWDIEFVATVVYKYDKFWTDIKSIPLMSTSRLPRNNKLKFTYHFINCVITFLFSSILSSFLLN